MLENIKIQNDERKIGRLLQAGWRRFRLLPGKPLYRPHLCRKQAAGRLRSFYILK